MQGSHWENQPSFRGVAPKVLLSDWFTSNANQIAVHAQGKNRKHKKHAIFVGCLQLSNCAASVNQQKSVNRIQWSNSFCKWLTFGLWWTVLQANCHSIGEPKWLVQDHYEHSNLSEQPKMHSKWEVCGQKVMFGMVSQEFKLLQKADSCEPPFFFPTADSCERNKLAKCPGMQNTKLCKCLPQKWGWWALNLWRASKWHPKSYISNLLVCTQRALFQAIAFGDHMEYTKPRRFSSRTQPRPGHELSMKFESFGNNGAQKYDVKIRKIHPDLLKSCEVSQLGLSFLCFTALL